MNKGINWNDEPMRVSREVFDGIAVNPLDDVLSDILNELVEETNENIDDDVEMEDVFEKKNIITKSVSKL